MKKESTKRSVLCRLDRLERGTNLLISYLSKESHWSGYKNICICCVVVVCTFSCPHLAVPLLLRVIMCWGVQGGAPQRLQFLVLQSPDCWLVRPTADSDEGLEVGGEKLQGISPSCSSSDKISGGGWVLSRAPAAGRQTLPVAGILWLPHTLVLVALPPCTLPSSPGVGVASCCWECPKSPPRCPLTSRPFHHLCEVSALNVLYIPHSEWCLFPDTYIL